MAEFYTAHKLTIVQSAYQVGRRIWVHSNQQPIYAGPGHGHLLPANQRPLRHNDQRRCAAASTESGRRNDLRRCTATNKGAQQGA